MVLFFRLAFLLDGGRTLVVYFVFRFSGRSVDGCCMEKRFHFCFLKENAVWKCESITKCFILFTCRLQGCLFLLFQSTGLIRGTSSLGDRREPLNLRSFGRKNYYVHTFFCNRSFLFPFVLGWVVYDCPFCSFVRLNRN